jgi:hypothetical protein
VSSAIWNRFATRRTRRFSVAPALRETKLIDRYLLAIEVGEGLALLG